MRPLIFEFKEDPKGESLDYTLIEYDFTLNLSVNRNTRQPAIEFIDLETETCTKTYGEAIDSDRDGIGALMETETVTRTFSEATDSDKDFSRIESLMVTTTLTESTETSDQDRTNYDLNHYS